MHYYCAKLFRLPVNKLTDLLYSIERKQIVKIVNNYSNNTPDTTEFVDMCQTFDNYSHILLTVDRSNGISLFERKSNRLFDVVRLELSQFNQWYEQITAGLTNLTNMNSNEEKKQDSSEILQLILGKLKSVLLE